jgi:3-oxoacyl-[acyl-carrier protein] reductase
MTQDIRLKSKTYIVTGASRGIGKEIVINLLNAGANVIGTSTKQTSDELKHENLQMEYANFINVDEVDAFCERMSSIKKIDGLINNAGINIIKPLDQISHKDYADVIALNLTAPFMISQAIANKMKEQGGGRIVNIASIWSRISKPKRTIYTTSKTGLVGLTRAMAVELAPYGIYVNCVSPGFTLTDLTQQSLSTEEIDDLSQKIPLGRMADPAEIAQFVCYMCSEQNTYITGQNIVIDGGFTIV